MFIYALLVNFAVHLNYVTILCYYYVILIVIFLHLINFGRKLIKPSFLNFKVIVIFCNPKSVFLVIDKIFHRNCLEKKIQILNFHRNYLEIWFLNYLYFILFLFSIFELHLVNSI